MEKESLILVCAILRQHERGRGELKRGSKLRSQNVALIFILLNSRVVSQTKKNEGKPTIATTSSLEEDTSRPPRKGATMTLRRKREKEKAKEMPSTWVEQVTSR